MSKMAMRKFETQDDLAFGYTPDTAYFMLDGMFRQRLAEPASRLTLNHLAHYNFSADWNLPVAPEAYRRDGRRFGDQYSNFNAGKILLYLEGLAGLSYSVPDRSLVVRDAMPRDWTWMEVRFPVRVGSQTKTSWPAVRFERSHRDGVVTKSIRVTDAPLRISIEPWAEGLRTTRASVRPMSGRAELIRERSGGRRFLFEKQTREASVSLRLGDR
jgi:hypothetical protein